MSKDLQLVHITDIHFSRDSLDRSRTMIKAFAEDLRKHKSPNKRMIILITGDVVNHGSSEAQYHDFYKCFDENLGPLDAEICCIPGNHDTSRSYVSSHFPALLGISDNLKNLLSLTNYLDNNEDVFCEAMEQYIAFESGFADLPTCQQSVYGTGHILDENHAIYCLNSGFYAFAGYETEQRKTDRGYLLANIGHLRNWLNDNQSIDRKIIAHHHPLDWFRSDVREELDRIISNNFGLSLFGHLHQASPIRLSTPTSNTLICQGGALSSSEKDKLFYQIFDIEAGSDITRLSIRHYSPSIEKFVSGSTITGTDCGTMQYENLWKTSSQLKYHDTIKLLSTQFEAALCSPFEGKKSMYVSPSISEKPLHGDTKASDQKFFSVSSIFQLAGDIVIHAPNQYGGSVLSLEFALEALRQDDHAVLLSATSAPSYKGKFDDFLKNVQILSKMPDMEIPDVFIIDDFEGAIATHRKLLIFLKAEYPQSQLIVIDRLATSLSPNDVVSPLSEAKSFYLNALTRKSVREIINQHPSIIEFQKDDDISSHILEEIERLNLHRIPFNVIMLMELVSKDRDFSPLNRAKLVQKYFELVFNRSLDSINYSEGMDFEDRMHFLTLFTSKLQSGSSLSFTEHNWIEFCNWYQEKFGGISSPMEELNLYLSTNIFAKNGTTYFFRLSMWTWYFTANRFNDDKQYREDLLDSRQYRSYPQVLEFSTGLKRDQTDLILTINKHLEQTLEEYEEESELSKDFTPYDDMIVGHDEANVEKFHSVLFEQVVGTKPERSLVDDSLDRHYNYAAPFNQLVQNSVYTDKLVRMYRTLEAVGACIRNSDHVDLDDRMKLTNTYFLALERFSQAAFFAIPEIVEKGRAHVSGMTFFYTRDPLEDKQVTFFDLIMMLPSRVGSQAMENIGSAKFWSKLAIDKRYEFSNFTKYLVMHGLIKLRNENWYPLFLESLEKFDSQSIYIERLRRDLLGTLYYGGFSEREKISLEKASTATLMKFHKMGKITVTSVDKEYLTQKQKLAAETLKGNKEG